MSESIFASENDESPIQTIRQTMSVSTNDDGVAVVSFATNRGKGSGAQVMPVDQFGDYVTALEEIAESGIPEASEQTLSAAESLRQTVKQEDGIVSFRVRSGKGAKPAKVPAGDLTEVAALLRGSVDAVTAAGLKLAPPAPAADGAPAADEAPAADGE
jgi:hypothetical protein